VGVFSYVEKMLAQSAVQDHNRSLAAALSNPHFRTMQGTSSKHDALDKFIDLANRARSGSADLERPFQKGPK
jgi:hypothetical protein